jgi:hypothetical protein
MKIIPNPIALNPFNFTNYVNTFTQNVESYNGFDWTPIILINF